MDKNCENYGSSWCADFECDECPVRKTKGSLKMPDKKVLEAVTEGALLDEEEMALLQKFGLHGAEIPMLHVENIARTQIAKLLSLRGNIVDGKFVQDEKGRYAVRVVDLRGELPDRCYFNEDNKDMELELSGHTQVEMLQSGFARIVGG